MLRWTIGTLYASILFATSLASPAPRDDSLNKLKIHLSVADGIVSGNPDGHVQVMFAPAGTNPLDSDDIRYFTYSNLYFGQNVYGLGTNQSIVLAGGSNKSTETGVYGWPNVSLNDVTPGDYSVQAFLNLYETAQRADGSEVTVRFPCGDGAPGAGGYGTPRTAVVNVTVTGSPQTIDLVFDDVTPAENFTGGEVGGCQQGNYADTELLKYVKIRSEALSAWWNRDVYVGATVLLPRGYDAADTATRYPVVYQHEHWGGANGAWGYPVWTDFASVWDNGTIPERWWIPDTPPRPTPKLILVTFRHENAFYRDSYVVNSANTGPWADAINDELIPVLDETFNTIAAPYARVLQGTSTGGWVCAASVAFRPDLFGACFSSFPDPLDFHSLEDIALYTKDNAYVREDGSALVAYRRFDNGTQVDVYSVAEENHWELTYGTGGRSIVGQWDIWNAVYGVQGLNGYPLVPWDKVTGQIDGGAVEYWKKMDLAEYITSNWDNTTLNLGEILKGRLYFYVGLEDNYFLNKGVAAFQGRVEAKGGAGWANFTYLEGQGHGGIYNLLDLWDFLELMETWVQDHAPTGATPLSQSVTGSAARGNKFEDVIAYGGRQAALARQGPPQLKDEGTTATVGRWDPGVVLYAQWIVNDQPSGDVFVVSLGMTVEYTGPKTGTLALEVTGRKRDYADETRRSNTASLCCA